MTEESVADSGLAGLHRRVRTSQRHRPRFTSALSVDELLLLEKGGYEPVELVSGSAVYHLGRVRRPWLKNAEVGQLTEALYSARREAMAKLVVAAADVRATGVTGIRVDLSFLKEGLARFVALGTAVTDKWSAHRSQPFTANLSGRELYVLERSGWRPLSIVMGSSVYHVGRRGPRAWAQTLARSQELDGYTAALYGARELAMVRMQAEAVGAGAQGVVGVQLVAASHVWSSHIIEFLAIGTGVIRNTHVPADLSPHLMVELMPDGSRLDLQALRADRDGLAASTKRSSDQVRSASF